MMSRTVGKRVEQDITFDADGELLKKGCLANDAMHQSIKMTGSGIPKGLYHFNSHKEANDHQDYWLCDKMARLALRNQDGK